MSKNRWVPLRAIRVENFKAVSDSQRINFEPFTLVVGNNGSGKSSLFEALETLRNLGTTSLDEVFSGPTSIEHVLYKGSKAHGPLSKDGSLSRPSQRLKIFGSGSHYTGAGLLTAKRSGFRFRTELAARNLVEEVVPCEEFVKWSSSHSTFRGEDGYVRWDDKKGHYPGQDFKLDVPESLLRRELESYFRRWQFLSLVPEHMGMPVPRRIFAKGETLNRDGSNVAECLARLKAESAEAFESIQETMLHILGYGKGIQPRQDLGAIKNILVDLEEGFTETIPGWMLSTGTLRIVALLIALRRPQPPSLLCIEEIENGLDPRTLSLLMNEIKFRTESKKIQVIATTHSPYLLDQVELEQVLIVHRDAGQPKFLRPSESEHVKAFVSRFDPGKMYTMGVLDGAVEELLR